MTEGSEPGVEIPPHVSLVDLEPWERHIWHTPDLTVEQREAAILLVRLQRGDLDDDTGSLRQLHEAIGSILESKP